MACAGSVSYRIFQKLKLQKAALNAIWIRLNRSKLNNVYLFSKLGQLSTKKNYIVIMQKVDTCFEYMLTYIGFNPNQQRLKLRISIQSIFSLWNNLLNRK